jgi:chromosome segregation ATPase
MSEDRLDRLETQMTQILELLGKLMNDFAQHRKEFADVVTVVIETEKKVANLERTVDRLDDRLTDFQKETRENFERVFRENSVTNRRIDLLTPTVSEALARVQELEKRMEKVEHQIAA